jgi:hypothetical protein
MSVVLSPAGSPGALNPLPIADDGHLLPVLIDVMFVLDKLHVHNFRLARKLQLKIRSPPAEHAIREGARDL